IIMPGGLGTLDEMFEMMTLIQTKKMRGFPLVLMGKSFWQPLITFMRATLLEQGTISSADVEGLLVTDSPEEAVDYIYTYLSKYEFSQK
ncbi:MAG: DNA-binding protein, partial [Gammaproteobacteria bacterium]|nr:DNA-binding protein [Gammaproteobacteria bacterium]